MKKAAASWLLIPALLLAGGCRERGGSKPQGKPGAQPLNVHTGRVVTRDVAYQVHALGSLEPDELVQTTAEVNGAVTEVLFNPGDRVTPATVLVRIDPERYRLEAARSEATYRKAVADLRRSQADLERRESLAKENLVAIEELTRARLETERLAADVAATKAAFDIAQQNRQRSEVRPPRAGVINTRNVDTGQFVQVGTVLATLVDTGRLRLRFRLSDAESLRIEKGQPVSFRVTSLGDSAFPAEVYHVGDIADPGTRQIDVLAWVKNPGPLKPGSFAEVLLATESHRNAVVIPESAVQASDRGFVAYVVREGRAQQRPITIGLRTGDGTVEIVSGLTPGEIVVTEGSDRLTDGITVQEAAPSTNRPARTR